MSKKMKYPHHIETDQGKTQVKLIPPRKATKIHLCPECEHETEIYEPHVLLLPTRFPGNRRYMHKHCYEGVRKSHHKIVLHPNLSYLTPLWD